MSADGQLKSIIERILRLHAEEDEIKSDRREVYGEAKANGYDKTALGAAVALIRKRDRLGEDAIAERETIVGLYLDAYDNAPRAHTHTRARGGPVPPEAAADPIPRRDVHTAHPESDHVDRSASAQPHSANGGPSIPSKPGDEGTGQGVFERQDTFGQPSGAETASAVRPGAPFNLPIAKPLRPNCLNREGCGSYTAEHCFICRQALENTEAA